MGLIHVRNPLVLLGYNYLKFYWFDQSSMGSLTHQLFSNQFMPSPLGIELLARLQLFDWGPAGPLDPLGVGFDFIFQVTGCAIIVAVPQRIWDYGRRHCAASWLDGVLCRVLRVPKPRMDDNSQTLH